MLPSRHLPSTRDPCRFGRQLTAADAVRRTVQSPPEMSMLAVVEPDVGHLDRYVAHEGQGAPEPIPQDDGSRSSLPSGGVPPVPSPTQATGHRGPEAGTRQNGSESPTRDGHEDRIPELPLPEDAHPVSPQVPAEACAPTPGTDWQHGCTSSPAHRTRGPAPSVTTHRRCRPSRTTLSSPTKPVACQSACPGESHEINPELSVCA